MARLELAAALELLRSRPSLAVFLRLLLFGAGQKLALLRRRCLNEASITVNNDVDPSKTLVGPIIQFTV